MFNKACSSLTALLVVTVGDGGVAPVGEGVVVLVGEGVVVVVGAGASWISSFITGCVSVVAAGVSLLCVKLFSS